MKYLSARTHTIIGFIVGLALLAAPNLFGFTELGGAAVWIPRLLGLIIIGSELTARGSFSGFGMIPMKMHVISDMLIGAFLAISPWLFGFADEEANGWVPHLVVGLLIIGYAAITRTEDTPAATKVL